MLNFVLSLKRNDKRMILLGVDILLVPIVLLATFILQFGLSGVWDKFLSNWPLATLLMMSSAGLSMMLGIMRIRLKSFERSAVGKVAIFAILLAVVAFSISSLGQLGLTKRFHVTFGILFFLASAGSRMFMLEVLLSIYRRDGSIKTVLIYGAGKTGMQLASALRSHPDIVPIGFIDDNIALKNQIVHGLPVYHGAQLDEVLDAMTPDRVVIAMPSAPRQSIAKLERRLEATGIDIQVVPSFAQLVGEEALEDRLKQAAPGAFLGRDHLHDHIDIGCDQYHGKNILISGAGGSIGSELCRQIMSCSPARLILFEMSELALYNIELELRDIALERGVELVPVLGNVVDRDHVMRVLGLYEIDVILHAAAYKHVPLVESNPIVGLSNNVFGTLSLASCARDSEVERFVLVSTDKAVRPANIMGASKRFAEIIVQDLASRSSGTVFSIVRFGNVLGSSGSVVPLFQDQVARGGPVTLTHNDVTRYFMTVQEAAQLVLTAGSLAEGGEMFVLDMGKPVPVRRLAEQVIESAGLRVKTDDARQGDIEIVETGLRPGEKLHEELTIRSGHMTTTHEKIFAVREEFLSELEIAGAVKALRDAISDGDQDLARSVIERWIHGYTPPIEQKLS
jgi:FlaA1/EpsC-like NDP-sugar epimerase